MILTETRSPFGCDRMFRYYLAPSGCCAEESWHTLACRYDMERIGVLPASEISAADLLIVSGVVTQKLVPEIKALYEEMLVPRHVMAVGACACSGGIFAKSQEIVLAGLQKVVPVDVFVPGCPPRPEAILNGIIKLQEYSSGIRASF